MATWYLGLATSGHDPALALVDETGYVRFAEATERFVQDKRAWGIAPDHPPHLQAAMAACGVDPARDRVVVGTSWSSVKAAIDVKVHTALLPGPDTLWLRGLQAQMQESAGRSLLRLGLGAEPAGVMRFDHHLCHAVTACHFTPWADASCLVLDGEGDVGAVSCFVLEDRRLKRSWRSWGPGSLGTFYAWLTFRCGWDWRLGEEWKVMGLAAYGRAAPGLLECLEELLTVDRGRLRFADDAAIAAIVAETARHARAPDAPVMNAADLAATGQAAYARFADRILEEVAKEGRTDLILTGGCALNSSYNGTIVGNTPFERISVPPCPADDGNAIGAALLAWMKESGAGQIPAGDTSPYLGTTPDAAAVAKCRHASRAYKVTDVSGRSAQAVAALLAEGRIIGVFRERAEIGPRALGNRSILADPRRPEMKDRINAEVKGREPYRPFAPVVLENDAGDWFERAQPSPYMSLTLPWLPSVRHRVPAVVHADGTGRLQTVSEDRNPWLANVVRTFAQKTDVPVVLNTSFNIMGKPIVHTLDDALAVLTTTGLDGVLCEELLIEKPM